MSKDIIYRQDAIDALDVLCQEHRYKIPGKFETYSKYNEAWQDALDRAEGAIGNLPSAQPEQRWIPCSERLPEKNCRCLTTNEAWGSFEVDWNVWIDGQWLYPNEKPIAWMPMPEPWKGDES